MTSGAILSKDIGVASRLMGIERDGKWQNLFTKLGLSAMLAVGISCIAVTGILIFQMSNLNVSIERLNDDVVELKSDVAVLKTDVATLNTDMVKVKTHLNINRM